MYKAIALIGVVAAGTAGAQTIDFDFFPGGDGLLGTADDVPIVAPSNFTDQTEQLTDQFASLGILFTPDPAVDGRNEILDSVSFSTPPSATAPNLLASSGSQIIEFIFTKPINDVGAIIGISGGEDILEAFDSDGNSLGSIVGDDEFVSLQTTTDIARVEIRAVNSTTPAIDNLTFVPAPATAALLGLGGLAATRRRR